MKRKTPLVPRGANFSYSNLSRKTTTWVFPVGLGEYGKATSSMTV